MIFNSWVTSHIGSTLVTAKRNFANRIFAPVRRRKLRDKNFTIICNNCYASMAIYQRLKIQYNTPTVGLFFYADDYIRFLEGFEKFVNEPLRFIKVSRHVKTRDFFAKYHTYPIGVLDDDIEIHFIHYKDEQEASEKWKRRKNRINYENLFFIFSDKDDFQPQYLHRFEMLPYKNKIFFSSKPSTARNVVFIKDYENRVEVGDDYYQGVFEKYYDVIKWLNCEYDFLKK
jgi:uncharacterized protein (DUF1919 family)